MHRSNQLGNEFIYLLLAVCQKTIQIQTYDIHFPIALWVLWASDLFWPLEKRTVSFCIMQYIFTLINAANTSSRVGAAGKFSSQTKWQQQPLEILISTEGGKEEKTQRAAFGRKHLSAGQSNSVHLHWRHLKVPRRTIRIIYLAYTAHLLIDSCHS